MKKGVNIFDCIVPFIILVMVLLASCTSTKQVSKQTTTVDSSYIKELESWNKMLITENERLNVENHELQYNSVEFDSTDCPPTQIIIDERCNVDSITAVLRDQFASTVKIHADGTIEAKGRLVRANASMQKLQKFVFEQSRTIDSLKKVKQKETVKTVTKTEYKDKYVKRSFMTGWWLWLLFFLAGVFVGVKYYRFIKSKIP